MAKLNNKTVALYEVQSALCGIPLTVLCTKSGGISHTKEEEVRERERKVASLTVLARKGWGKVRANSLLVPLLYSV